MYATSIAGNRYVVPVAFLTFKIPPDTRDISPEVLNSDGRMRILPASFWHAPTVAERALFGPKNGIYSLPTIELIARLTEIIGGRSAIEIGSGHGVVAETLGIPGTDSRQQEDPHYARRIALLGQPTVKYGHNIIAMHASRAVRRYKPDVVIGCWVTHKWDRNHPEREGNEVGVDEKDVILNCSTYVFVGNEETHKYSRIWDFNPQVEYPDYVISRAFNGSRDFIAVINRRRKT